MTKKQREELALQQAKLRLLDQGVPAQYVFGYAPGVMPEELDRTKLANVLKDEAQTRNTNQQYIQNLEEQPLETEKKKAELFSTMAKDRGAEGGDIASIATHLRNAADAFPTLSPAKAASLYELGNKYVDRNSAIIGQSDEARYGDTERAQYGAALTDTAMALGITPEAVLGNVSKNYVFDDTNKHENLLQGIGKAAASNMGGRELVTGSTWLNRLNPFGGKEGFLDEDVIRSYTNAKGGQLNVVNAARTIRMAASPEMRNAVKEQTGMEWEKYRDWMNEQPNSKELWTQYLMAVDERANSPKK